MTNEAIKKWLKVCVYSNCECCPYSDNYTTCTDRLKLDACEVIIEQEKEIDRLKVEFKQLQNNAEKLARGVRDLVHENYELIEKRKKKKTRGKI